MDTIYKKSWLKVVMALFVGLLALVLVACGDTAPSAQKLVDDAKDALKIVYGGTEDATKVTRNVTLTTKVTSELGDITVNWVSSHENIIEVSGQTGKVTRPDADTTVTLTATLTLDGKTATKPFELKVLAAETSPSDALAALNIAGATFNEGTGRYTVAGDLTLPNTSEGLAVTWSSTPAGIISSTGEVTRPAWNASDALVQLTATISGEERTFVMVVLKVTEKPVSAKLQDAADVLLIPGTTDGVTVDLTLAATAGQEGVTVTWQSSNTDILSHDGKLSYPDEVTTVVMTATLSYPDSAETLTKEFSLTVLASVEAEAFATVQALKEAGKTWTLSSAPYVMVEGVTIAALTKDGLIVADETGYLFVYTGAAPDKEKFVVGSVIDIYGVYDVYFGSPQVKSVVGGKPVRAVASEAAVTALTPTEVLDIPAYLASVISRELNPDNPFTQSHLLDMEYLEVTAKVRVQGSGNYDVLLVHPTYAGGNIDTSGAATSVSDKALMIYYQSNIEDVRLFNGLEVKLRVFLNARRTNNDIYAVVFTGTADDITPVATNEEMVNIVGAAIQNGINKEYAEAATLNLPATMLGATITYTSDNALINAETGVVTMPETGQVAVTLTAKVVRDGSEKEFAIIVKVGELPFSDVSDARADFEKGSSVRVKGTLTGMANARYFIIEDETGSIAVYIGNNGNPWYAPSSPTADTIAKINAFWNLFGGKELDLEGVYDDYNGLIYINPVKIKVTNQVGTKYPATDINAVALTSADLAPYQSQNVLISNLEIKEIPTQSYGNILFVLTNGTNDIDFFWDARTLLVGGNTSVTITDYLSQFKVGDKVDIVGATLGQKNSSTMRLELNAVTNIVEHLELPTTDEGKTDSASSRLDIPTQTTAATIILPATGLWETTITWASDNSSVINAETGAVTVPTGPAVEVTLTATIKSGEFTKDYDFVVTVGVATSTVAQARSLSVGSKVAVNAVITSVGTAEDGKLVAFAQDSTAGIYLYKVAAADSALFVVGDELHIVGETAVFNGLIQITNFTSITNVSTGNAVTPVAITDPAEVANHPGQFVEVSGYLRETPGSGAEDFFLITAEGQFAIRLGSGKDIVGTVRDAAQAALVGKPEGSLVTFTGGIGQFNQNMQLMLFNADQITVGAVGTPSELAQAALANLALPEANLEVTTDVTLPVSGKLGITLTWTSSNEAAMTNDGKVTRTSSDQAVTMTYSAKIGGVEVDTGTVLFTVLAESDEPEEQTITFESPATSLTVESGIITETNGITTSPNLIFEVIKNESTGLGLYSDFRLYGHRQTGNGSGVKISAKEGFKITNLVVHFAGSTNNVIGTIQFDAEEKINLSFDDLKLTQTYTDLNVTQFVIHNIGNTTTNPGSNGQIRFTKIEVTYIEIVEGGELALLYNLTDATGSTDYDPQTVTLTNLLGGTQTISTTRTAVNFRNTWQTKNSIVLAPRKELNASATFTLVDAVSKLTFNAGYWTAISKPLYESLVVQVKVGENWVDAYDLLADENIVAEAFYLVTVNFDSPVNEVRIFGTTKANQDTNNARFCADNFQFFG